MRLTGHRILITGGTSGIGLGLARAFHGRGNRVAVAGRSAERLARAAEELPGLVTVQADLAVRGEAEGLLEDAVTRLGGLTILVNNAGIQCRHDYLTDDPVDVLREIRTEIAVNIEALITLSIRALPLLRAADESAIVNISSILAFAPKRSAPVYCASKAAVHSFTRALRYQVREGASHVRMVDVQPPAVDTPMTAGRGRPEDKLTVEQVTEGILGGLARDAEEIPLGRTRSARLLLRVAPGWVFRRLRDA